MKQPIGQLIFIDMRGSIVNIAPTPREKVLYSVHVHCTVHSLTVYIVYTQYSCPLYKNIFGGPNKRVDKEAKKISLTSLNCTNGNGGNCAKHICYARFGTHGLHKYISPTPPPTALSKPAIYNSLAIIAVLNEN